MNERQITVGMDGDGKGFYAMFCNDAVIYAGETAIDAVERLFEGRFPFLWLTEEEKESNMIDEHQLSVDIAEVEGKKEEVDIAQIKEVLHIVIDKLSDHSNEEILELMEKYRKSEVI